MTYPSASEVVTAINDIKDRVICGAPEALIIKTGRLAPHSKGDDTRSDPEIEYLHQLDPVQISIEKLNQFQKDSLNDEIEKFLGELNTIARQKREPCVMPTSENLTIETKLNDFSELDGRTFSQRLNNELAKYVNDHNNVVVVGEDIHDPYGGAFKITRGIQSKNPNKVFSTPISEAGFTGISAGAALLGMRPIVEFMFADFVALAADQIINHAAKYRQMYNSKVECPLVIRLPSGAGRGYGPTHSQYLENLFFGIPGLSIFALSRWLPVKSFYRLITQNTEPVILIEDKVEYSKRANYQEANLTVDIVDNNSSVIFKQIDSHDLNVALFCYGAGVGIAIEAQEALLVEYEIDAVVIAVAKLCPLDLGSIDTHLRSVKNCVVIDHSIGGGGFEQLMFKELYTSFSDCNLSSVRAPNITIPASAELETSALISPEKIVDHVIHDKMEQSRLMQQEIQLLAPKLNANDDDLKVVKVHCEYGQKVHSGTLIADLETTKSVFEFTSSHTGFVYLSVKEGDVVNVGSLLGVIREKQSSGRVPDFQLNLTSKMQQNLR